MIQAPARYQGLHTNPDLVYDAICKTISDRINQVDWAVFDAAAWDLFSKMALMENVGPLIYWEFKDDRWPPNIPPEAAAALMGQYYQTLKVNSLRFAELDRIIDAFNAADIPLILLKGAHLARTLYPDIGLRPMGDLDLLVHREDLDRCSNELSSIGFEQRIMEQTPGAELNFGHDQKFWNDGGLLLELHWSLIGGDSDRRSPAMSIIWDNPGVVCLPGLEHFNCFALTDEIHICYLSAHLALQHGLEAAPLLWFYDIYAFLKKSDGDSHWKDVQIIAFELNWPASLDAALSTLNYLFNIPIPEEYQQINGSMKTHEAGIIEQRKTQSSRSTITWQQLILLDRDQRMKYILSLIFPSRDYMLNRYQIRLTWIYPLYYPYRWWDIASDIIRTLHQSTTET